MWKEEIREENVARVLNERRMDACNGEDEPGGENDADMKYLGNVTESLYYEETMGRETQEECPQSKQIRFRTNDSLMVDTEEEIDENEDTLVIESYNVTRLSRHPSTVPLIVIPGSSTVQLHNYHLVIDRNEFQRSNCYEVFDTFVPSSPPYANTEEMTFESPEYSDFANALYETGDNAFTVNEIKDHTSNARNENTGDSTPWPDGDRTIDKISPQDNLNHKIATEVDLTQVLSKKFTQVELGKFQPMPLDEDGQLPSTSIEYRNSVNSDSYEVDSISANNGGMGYDCQQEDDSSGNIRSYDKDTYSSSSFMTDQGVYDKMTPKRYREKKHEHTFGFQVRDSERQIHDPSNYITDDEFYGMVTPIKINDEVTSGCYSFNTNVSPEPSYVDNQTEGNTEHGSDLGRALGRNSHPDVKKTLELNEFFQNTCSLGQQTVRRDYRYDQCDGYDNEEPTAYSFPNQINRQHWRRSSDVNDERLTPLPSSCEVRRNDTKLDKRYSSRGPSSERKGIESFGEYRTDTCQFSLAARESHYPSPGRNSILSFSGRCRDIQNDHPLSQKHSNHVNFRPDNFDEDLCNEPLLIQGNSTEEELRENSQWHTDSDTNSPTGSNSDSYDANVVQQQSEQDFWSVSHMTPSTMSRKATCSSNDSDKSRDAEITPEDNHSHVSIYSQYTPPESASPSSGDRATSDRISPTDSTPNETKDSEAFVLPPIAASHPYVFNLSTSYENTARQTVKSDTFSLPKLMPTKGNVRSVEDAVRFQSTAQWLNGTLELKVLCNEGRDLNPQDRKTLRSLNELKSQVPTEVKCTILHKVMYPRIVSARDQTLQGFVNNLKKSKCTKRRRKKGKRTNESPPDRNVIENRAAWPPFNTNMEQNKRLRPIRPRQNIGSQNLLF